MSSIHSTEILPEKTPLEIMDQESTTEDAEPDSERENDSEADIDTEADIDAETPHNEQIPPSNLTTNNVNGLLPSTSTAAYNTVPMFYDDGSIGTLYIEKLKKTIKI